MFVVGEALIDETICKVSFKCDLSACKGACCCIEGGRGAPLADDEVPQLHAALTAVLPLLSERSRTIIGKRGPIDGRPGDYATTCIDNRDCVFVYYAGEEIAHCSFERAFDLGLTSWRKPLSCHLFPIRSRRLGTEVLRYEEIGECAPALNRGTIDQMPLFEFLEVPLIRRFGHEWYKSFRRSCREHFQPTDK
jgi:hypothetical protein